GGTRKANVKLRWASHPTSMASEIANRRASRGLSPNSTVKALSVTASVEKARPPDSRKARPCRSRLRRAEVPSPTVPCIGSKPYAGPIDRRTAGAARRPPDALRQCAVGHQGVVFHAPTGRDAIAVAGPGVGMAWMAHDDRTRAEFFQGVLELCGV